MNKTALSANTLMVAVVWVDTLSETGQILLVKRLCCDIFHPDGGSNVAYTTPLRNHRSALTSRL